MTISQNSADPKPGLILRESDPLNLEFPFDQLNGRITPNDLFYVRSHFPIPPIDPASFRLNVCGAVTEPLSLSLDQLRALPSVTRAATLECAGNSRIFLSPQASGVQWQLGGVSTAEWTGVPLSAVLEHAGLRHDVCEIGFEAADKGTPKSAAPPGQTPYARSIPVAKAGDALLAWAMNGEPLPPEHGFPLRAIVPGYYAMASVKWLTRIRALTRSADYYWQTSDYAYWDDLDGNPVRRPLFDLQLKSAISRPRMMETVPAGVAYTVSGAAWGGKAQPSAVEVSFDNGRNWQPAEWLDPAQPFVWRRWRLLWNVPPDPGTYTLQSRVRSQDGEVQPARHDPRFGSYVIHHTLPIRVTVRCHRDCRGNP